ncbi:hypothetical protein BgiMline_015171 [Biomphalaria glabrata]|nr:hypothetical protein BgiMline_022280 [Biomphalaria glabrata]
MKRSQTYLSLTIVCLQFVGVVFSKPQASATFVEKLLELTADDQTKKDLPYVPLKEWHRAKGVYSSGVKLNFNGALDMAEARRLFDVFDNNMFVTSWVTSTLLEAVKYGGTPAPSNEQLTLAIQAFSKYHDKNQQYNTSTMSFWPLVFNSTLNYWSCAPDNLVATFDITDELPMNVIEALLKVLGMENLVDEIEFLLRDKDMYLRAFHIPPDFDDTFINLGLGALLFEQRKLLPEAWSLWQSQNMNLTSVFDALKKYAYRPFSSDPNVNTIDPRTYFYIRKFLDKAKADGGDIALVTTWIQSIEELRMLFYLNVGMPFQLNNVDVTVAANTIYGITSSILSGLVSPDVLADPVLEQIYINTSSLIAFVIKTNFTGRPDLALTYYPSQIEFYWFVSRTVSALATAAQTGSIPLVVMEAVYNILKNATQYEMTKAILAQAKSEQSEKVYFDDFLGDGDVTHDHKPLIRGEDRIFTTAMAANALMNTWSIFDESTGKSHWRLGTPQTVLRTIMGCITWLTQHTLDGNYDPWNAFFSGSAKDMLSLPFWYPANRFEYLNGTAIKDWSTIPNSTFLYGVSGYIQPDAYNAMLTQPHFGMPTPLTFPGYNTNSSMFPFWSSAPYTYTTTALAVSKFMNIVG